MAKTKKQPTIEQLEAWSMFAKLDAIPYFDSVDKVQEMIAQIREELKTPEVLQKQLHYDFLDFRNEFEEIRK